MKLSNKILIGFFGLILVYMIAAFTEIRLKGDFDGMIHLDRITETIEVKDLRYLKVKNMGRSINVTGSDTARIEIKSVSGDLIKHLEYDFTGDTLSLLKLNLEEERHFTVTVFVPHNQLKGLTIDNSFLVMRDFKQDTLSVEQTKGSMSIYGSSKISQLNYLGTDKASLDLINLNLNLMNVKLDDSKVIGNAAVGILEGSMRNESYIYLRENDEVRIKKEGSNKLLIN